MSDDMQTQLAAQIQGLVKEIDVNPNDWRTYVDLITALTAQGDFVQAEELGLKSLDLFKDNQQAQAYLAYATGNNYYSAGYYQQAQEFFKLVNDDALAHDVTMMQAQSWYAQKQYRQALAFALTGTEQNANDIDAFILLGNIWLALNEMSSAKIAFEQAVQLDSNSYQANFGRGLVAQVEQTSNPWFEQAKALDSAKFYEQVQQLDDLLNVMTGGEHNGGAATEYNGESTNT